ncbi:MAG TPA: phosphotransferase, partial [Acidimicrobiales bacterium]|nr:phosphotransferase [Acidimicrobiales bacterium]
MRTAVGAAHTVQGWEVLRPWSVARIHLSGGETATVVAKWLRDGRDGLRADPSQVTTEYSALVFLSRVSPGSAPRPLGVDQEAGVLLLEDLGPRRPLLDLIVEAQGGAKEGLRLFAADLARMHVKTRGGRDGYYQERARWGPVDPRGELLRFCHPLPDLDGLGDVLGAPARVAVTSDVARLLDELAEPGPFLAFSNGDSGVNNYLIHGRDGRFIDFEFAGFRHCLTDVACLYVPGPQWMAVADPRDDGTETTYRLTLSASVSEAEDDGAYGLGISSAGLGYALHRLGRLPVLDARPAGHESRRQMITTLAAAVRTARRFGCLTGLAGWVENLGDRLRRRWPDA